MRPAAQSCAALRHLGAQRAALGAAAGGAALVAGPVAGLGFAIGQHAVGVVLAIDRYALWITLSLVVVVAYRGSRKAHAEQKAKKAAAAQEALRA